MPWPRTLVRDRSVHSPVVLASSLDSWPDVLTTVLSLAVLGFMATRLVTGVRVARSVSGRAVVREVRRRIAWRHVWPVPIVLTAVLVAAGTLIAAHTAALGSATGNTTVAANATLGLQGDITIT
eukprot:gene30623-52799_t